MQSALLHFEMASIFKFIFTDTSTLNVFEMQISNVQIRTSQIRIRIRIQPLRIRIQLSPNPSLFS